MSKHTPGPWIARMNCDVMAGERRVADCMTGWLREGRANARLIAAAPELLESLSRLTQEIYTLRGDFGTQYPALAEATILARAAIAKAEGVES